MRGIEVGLVPTDLEPMVLVYEAFLELETQGEIEFGELCGAR